MARYNPFRSTRLIYRAPEPESTDDQDLYLEIMQEPTNNANSSARINVPRSRSEAIDFLKSVPEKYLLATVICLPPDSENDKPIPIGTLHLSRLAPYLAHHRFAEISIDITTPYQSNGYGSEAIRWVLSWAFDVAGLHRVNIRCFEWNFGARRLYERLGFKLEGRSRELLWFQGRFWDDFQFGILEREWREMKGKEEAEDAGKVKKLAV